jgi:hypothetical protein
VPPDILTELSTHKLYESIGYNIPVQAGSNPKTYSEAGGLLLENRKGFSTSLKQTVIQAIEEPQSKISTPD